MLGSGSVRSVFDVESGDFCFDDQGPKDWLGEVDGNLPELARRAAVGRRSTPHKERSGWLHRFASVLGDSFENFGIDLPVYPFSEH